MYDVIIIGAGTAGLTAARQLSNNFLILESKKEIGYPLRCGEGIREDIFTEFFDYKHFPFIRNSVYELVLIVNNLRRTVKESYIQVDKPKFEQWLADPVKEHIKLRYHVNLIKKTKECVEIYTDKQVFRAKLVIIATGSVFKLQKQLGLCNNKKEILLGYGGIYKNYRLDKNKFYFIFDDKFAGYFWVFPKTKDIVNIGFGALNTNKNVKNTFNLLLKKYCPKAESIYNYAGLIDCSGPIKKTYTNRVIVCGGAAGFVHAATGEGIPYALISGKIAGTIAQKAVQKNEFSARFLKQYEIAWKKAIGNQLVHGLDINLLMRTAYKYGVFEKIFKSPTEQEAREMITMSKLPKRAKLAVRFIKLFGLDTKDLNKKPISKRLRLAYKLANRLSQ